VNEPRRHHYVTEAFLAGFTERGTRDDMVWVHDLQRRWALLIAARGLSRFVASDNPVTFVPLEEQVALNGWGWATPSTAAAIPLTKRCALIGTFEQPPVDARVVSSPREIAHVNGWTVRTASRFVFSAGKDFIWTRPDGRMGNAADVFGSR
jgi:hypothetical protein